jgi:hypothetical protein
MKKYFLLVMLGAAMTVSAQFNTGSLYFTGLTGANLGYERQTQISDFVTQSFNYIIYDLHLEGGYFVRNRLAVGGKIFTRDEHGSSIGLGDASGERTLFFGPTIRYYIPREDDLQIYYYGNPYFGFGTYGNTLGITGGVGVNYFLTERVAIEARGSYTFHRFFEEFFQENTHTILFEIGISLFFPSITFFDQS